MNIMKSALLGSAATLVAVAGAQAADLPSKKAAPATYVKVCDAYGAGFFYIPGTDTCLKVGGYVRAEYQYTPAVSSYNSLGTLVSALSASATPKALQDTTGYEVRGRIEVDARTPTSMGPARTFVRLRAATNSGLRSTTFTQGAGYTNGGQVAAAITMEAAMVQWAGFTFGRGNENYAMMTGIMYGGAPWAGFPNGMNQLAYTHNFGGGFSATVAIEDRRDSFNQTGSTYNHTATNGLVKVGVLRLDQSWGFAAIHGMSSPNAYATVSGAPIYTYADFTAGTGLTTTSATGVSNKEGWAIGTTVSFKLPMIAQGDQVWLTANYADGATSALMGGSTLNAVNDSSQKKLLGGIMRVEGSLVAVGGTTGLTATGVDTTKGWNVGGLFTHYWASNIRSNFAGGYIEFNPPTATTTTTTQWGQGKVYTGLASVIYSPAKDLDIGLEVQYANMTNKVQNNTYSLTDAKGLSSSNWSTKLRVERNF
jgi:hypothetical protein